ncbi:uncharacterized protein LOC143463185 isoform X1 [Clavelina lepadiformis]|uniref:uncharacterized protein LOC143463185 isoform X1 n=2 Tax=Clavelina lepadiformis TaxID=159417 RepID=UPI004040FB69
MMDTSKKKASKLTAGRYKLIRPCHPNRGGDIDDLPKAQSEKPETTISAQGQVIQESGSGQRIGLQPPSNEAVKQEIDTVTQYLKNLGLVETLEKFTSELLQNNDLPYNPYPSYIKRFRRLAERFHVMKTPLSVIKRRLDAPVYNVGQGILYGIKKPNTNIWGLQHIVALVNAKTVESYRHMIESSTVISENISQKLNQQISIFTTLCGPCIFSHSFYEDWSEIAVKLTVLVTAAKDMNSAARTFAHILVEDIKLIESHKMHHFTELIVPVEEKNGWNSITFSNSEIKDSLSTDLLQGSDFFKFIILAAVARRRISVNCVLNQSDTNTKPNYIPVVKMYHMMFLQTNAPQNTVERGKSLEKTTKSLPQLVMSTLPYQALYEGLFLDRSQADLYITTFQKHFKLKSEGSSKTTTKLDPLHRDILGSVVQAWQLKVASSVLENEVFATLHYMLLIHLTQTRTKSFAKHLEEDFAIQISRCFSGSLFRIHKALSIAPSILSLVTSFAASDILKHLIAKFHKELVDVVDRDMSTRSTEMKLLKELVVSMTENYGNASLNPNMLHQLQHFILYVSLGLAEDTVELLPAVLAMKSQINLLYPNQVPTKYAFEKLKNQHGIQNTSWIESDKLKLNKEICDANSQAPKNIARHYSLFQYCADIRIDETWKEFLERLLLYEDHLPPNPYPILISLLRRSSMSVQTLFESTRAVVSRLQQHKIVAVDDVANIYNVTGTSAYGQRPSLQFVHPLGFRQVSDVVTKLASSSPGDTVAGLPVLLGNFLVVFCTGITLTSCWYGNISPYLGTLEMDEHCYIQGPKNQINQASATLARKVFSDLQTYRKNGVVTYQARFGEIVMDIKNLTTSSTRFESEFMAAVNGNKVIQLIVYFPLAWRYILVKKRFLVYYKDELSGRTSPMFKISTTTDRRNCTIFLDPNDASYCLRAFKSPTMSDDKSIKNLWHMREWPQVLQKLIARSQVFMANDLGSSISSTLTEKEAHAILAFSWRYYNSTPGQVDYVMSLVDGLKAVVYFIASSNNGSAEQLAPFNSKLFEEMFFDCRNKLNEVVERASSLNPASMSSLLLKLMDNVAYKDSSSGLRVNNIKRSMEALRDVKGYLWAIRNCTADDLLEVSPLVKDCILKL